MGEDTRKADAEVTDNNPDALTNTRTYKGGDRLG